MTPEQREAEIDRVKDLIDSNYQAGNLDQARIWAHCMSMLIAGRSDEVVSEMEQRLGLR